MKLINLLFVSIILFTSSVVAAGEQKNSDVRQKAILVTGANSGIGLKMTKELSNNGFYVYAGVLHKNEMAEMNAMDNVTAVQFDVRNQAEVDAAVDFVKKQGRGLYGLINNAGVSVFGPVLEIPIEQLHYQMDVNVYGVMRVMQAFAPLIIESKGRIVTTGSIAGIVSSPLFGIYSMSKHAIEAYTDALSQEIARFGVRVPVIEPGTYKTNIGYAAKKYLEDEAYWTEDTLFPQERAYLDKAFAQIVNHPDPAPVGKAALHVMQSDKPRSRYMVIETTDQANRVLRRQLSKMLELNDGQKHQFTDDQLKMMLAEEIAKYSANK